VARARTRIWVTGILPNGKQDVRNERSSAENIEIEAARADAFRHDPQ